MTNTISQYVSDLIGHDSIWIQVLMALLIVLVAIAVRGLFTRFVFGVVMKFTKKTKTDIDSAILTAFEPPFRSFILVIGFYIAFLTLPIGPELQNIISTIFRSFIIIFAAWGLYNLAGGTAYRRICDELNIDKILADFVTGIIRFLVIALAISVIAQEWDYDVNGFLAGLGLGGLAIALAAKDAVANIFGGVVIILDKPFEVGDWILTSNVEGTVEEMNFRSTKVRTFANALVTVPNSAISNQAITNWARMKKRQITFRLGLTYSTPRDKLQICVKRIKDLLEKHPEVHPDTIFVRFERFNDSSLDIFLYFFTKTTVWGDFLQVREEINLKIMEILEEENVSIAFPSRSIYVETKDWEKAISK